MRCNWRMAGDQRHALTFTASVKSRHSTNHHSNPFIYRMFVPKVHGCYVCVLGSQLHHHSPHLIFLKLELQLEKWQPVRDKPSVPQLWSTFAPHNIRPKAISLLALLYVLEILLENAGKAPIVTLVRRTLQESLEKLRGNQDRIVSIDHAIVPEFSDSTNLKVRIPLHFSIKPVKSPCRNFWDPQARSYLYSCR